MSLHTREQVQGHLHQLAQSEGLAITDPGFAAILDARDELAHFRSRFNIPLVGDMAENPTGVDPKSEAVYFLGNSLGLQPKIAQEMVKTEMDKWAKTGLYGNFSKNDPWYSVEDVVVEESARLVGAKPIEVAVMNTLTVNIHLALAAFYQPTKERNKILVEDAAFPSDLYAVESQIRWHGYSSDSSLILMAPKKGEAIWRTKDVIKVIEENGDSLAFIWLSGIHYATGHVFDMKEITCAAHSKGCYIGFDLAHAAGNIEMHLHDWEVDVAAWCGYKYLNAGPGGIAGFFVHEKHADNSKLPRLLGWWSHNRDTRMKMTNILELQPGAAGFQLSNPPILPLTCLKASLSVFKETSMAELCNKSRLLTGYLELLLEKNLIPQSANTGCKVTILTSQDVKQRGCQLSLTFSKSADEVKKFLKSKGVFVDSREPNLIRVPPVPLYNTFSDVLRFYLSLCEAVNSLE